MKLTIEEEFQLDTLWFLTVIKSEKSDYIDFPFVNRKVHFSETGETPSFERQQKIINYLEKQKVLMRDKVTIISFNKEHRKKYGFDGPAIKDEKDVVTIINRKKFEETYKKYKALKINTEKVADPINELWITKNNNGDYLFDGEVIDIKNDNANYFKIFDTVLSLKPNGGLVPYGDIVKKCKDRKLRTNRQSILRSLSGDSAIFFSHIKIPIAPSGGVSLFRAKRDNKHY